MEHMHTRKSSAWLALLLSFLIAVPPVGLAEDTELFTTSANPNVLLMLDVSGSMNTVTGDTDIGDLDGNGTSNTRLDALWKVVYTLLNANLSRPSHDNGTTATITATLQTAKRSDRTTTSTSISNSSGRTYDWITVNMTNGNWSDFPATGALVLIGSGGQSETLGYTSRSTTSSTHTFYFSPAKHFNNSYNQNTPVSYTYATGGGHGVIPPELPDEQRGSLERGFPDQPHRGGWCRR
jgi:hypothetical protein